MIRFSGHWKSAENVRIIIPPAIQIEQALGHELIHSIGSRFGQTPAWLEEGLEINLAPMLDAQLDTIAFIEEQQLRSGDPTILPSNVVQLTHTVRIVSD